MPKRRAMDSSIAHGLRNGIKAHKCGGRPRKTRVRVQSASAPYFEVANGDMHVRFASLLRTCSIKSNLTAAHITANLDSRSYIRSTPLRCNRITRCTISSHKYNAAKTAFLHKLEQFADRVCGVSWNCGK